MIDHSGVMSGLMFDAKRLEGKFENCPMSALFASSL